jgi:hypothetical protein
VTAPTWPAGTRPTAEQLDEFLTVCSATERRDTLDRLLTHDEAGLRCWELMHEHRLESAEAQVRQLVEQLENARRRLALPVVPVTYCPGELTDAEADALLVDLARRLGIPPRPAPGAEAAVEWRCRLCRRVFVDDAEATNGCPCLREPEHPHGYTSHGHPIPGRLLDPSRRPLVARCGGPGLCSACSREAAA